MSSLGGRAVSDRQPIAETTSALILELARCETVRTESRRGAVLWGLAFAVVVAVGSLVRMTLLVLLVVTVFYRLAYHLARYRRVVKDVRVYEAALRQESPSVSAVGALESIPPQAFPTGTLEIPRLLGSIDHSVDETAGARCVADGDRISDDPSAADRRVMQPPVGEPVPLGIPELRRQMSIGKGVGRAVSFVAVGLCALVFSALYGAVAAIVAAVCVVWVYFVVSYFYLPKD
jgi:hypothetical protein